MQTISKYSLHFLRTQTFLDLDYSSSDVLIIINNQHSNSYTKLGYYPIKSNEFRNIQHAFSSELHNRAYSDPKFHQYFKFFVEFLRLGSASLHRTHKMRSAGASFP